MSDQLRNLSDREILILTCAEVQNITKGHEELKGWLLGVDRRVHTLERWRNFLAGSTLTAMGIGSLAIKIVWGKVNDVLGH